MISAFYASLGTQSLIFRKGFAIAPYQLAAYSATSGAISSCVATDPEGQRDEVKFLLLALKKEKELMISFNHSAANHAYKEGRLEFQCTGSIDQSFTLNCGWTFPAQNETPSVIFKALERTREV